MTLTCYCISHLFSVGSLEWLGVLESWLAALSAASIVYLFGLGAGWFHRTKLCIVTEDRVGNNYGLVLLNKGNRTLFETEIRITLHYDNCDIVSDSAADDQQETYVTKSHSQKVVSELVPFSDAVREGEAPISRRTVHPGMKARFVVFDRNNKDTKQNVWQYFYIASEMKFNPARIRLNNYKMYTGRIEVYSQNQHAHIAKLEIQPDCVNRPLKVSTLRKMKNKDTE